MTILVVADDGEQLEDVGGRVDGDSVGEHLDGGINGGGDNVTEYEIGLPPARVLVD